MSEFQDSYSQGDEIDIVTKLFCLLCVCEINTICSERSNLKSKYSQPYQQIVSIYSCFVE